MTTAAPRFFIDHGMIHDRVTGKHVTTDEDTVFCDGINHCLALLNELNEAAASLPDVGEMVRLFPEAFDVLTRQEMRDAKGNWRSLIDQQNAALRKLRAALNTTKGQSNGE